MLTELDKQAFQAAVSLANSGQKPGAFRQLLELARKNPDEVNLLLWAGFTAPDGRVASRLIRRAWSLNQSDPVVQMARQWLEKTYPIESAEVPDSLDLTDLPLSTESPPPPPFFAGQNPPPPPGNNPSASGPLPYGGPPPYAGPPPPPYSQVPPGYPPNFGYAVPPFVPGYPPGMGYGAYTGPFRVPFPYEVLPKRALTDLNGGLVFLIFLGYLVGGFIASQLFGAFNFYGRGFATFYAWSFFPWIIAAILATIEVTQRRSRYGAGSASHPVLIFFLVFLVSPLAFALYMADYHRFRFRREHGWYGPVVMR
jgi:uncharacterized membrane protein YeaQ/YmgE (transglycosylase-associated protein family)